MDKKYKDYVYKFTDTSFENPENLGPFKLIEKLVNGEKLSTGKDDGFDGWKHKDENDSYVRKPGYNPGENDYVLFNEIFNYDAYKSGIIKRMGWVFDFRPFFKKYVVKRKYTGWDEQYAYNKTFIRKCSSNPSQILKIIEI